MRAGLYAKALLAALILLVGIAHGPSHAQIGKPDNGDVTSGLVGHWRLDETSGTTAADSSGNDNLGTMSGTNFGTASVKGKVGNAGNFDGINDIISVGSAPEIEPANSLSVSAWIRANVVPQVDGSSIVSKRFMSSTDPFNSYFLGLRPDVSGDWSDLSFCVSSGVAGSQTCVVAGDTLTTNWRNVVGTYNGSDIRLYIDGVLAVAPVAFSSPIAYSTMPFSIGYSGGGPSSQRFNGLIDDVRIYNRALSADDVALLYRSYPGQVACTAAHEAVMWFNHDEGVMQYCNGTDWVSMGSAGEPGLVAHWTFDDIAGNRVPDRSGNRNHGTLHGNVTTALGAVGQAAVFDENVSTYIEVPHGPSLAIGDEFTLAYWINASNQGTSAADDYRATINKRAGGSSIGWTAGLHIYGPQVRLRTDTDLQENYAMVTTSGVTDGTWRHVVHTKSNGTAQVYLDGALHRSGTFAQGAGFANTDPIQIAPGLFTGMIDDVRIYNRALNTTEVANLFSATSGYSLGCTSPTGTAGELNYNLEYAMLQYCDGNNWISMGPQSAAAGSGGIKAPRIVDAGFGSNNVQEVRIVGTEIILRGSGEIRLTADGGVNWSIVPTAPINESEFDYDGSMLVVGSGNSISISKDLGASWTDRSTELNASNPRNVKPRLINGLLFAIDGNGVIKSSNDLGATWTDHTAAYNAGPAWIDDILSQGSSTIFGFGANGQIKRSTDNGISWSQVLGAGGRWFSDDLVFNDIIIKGGYIGTANDESYITVSEDNGNTWVERSLDGISTGNIQIAYNGTHLAVAKMFSEDLFVSTDLGQTWTDISAQFQAAPGFPIRDIAFNGTDLWIVGDNGGVAVFEDGFEDMGLIGYWKLDEASGTVAADSSSNSNNGTMLNGLSGANAVNGVVNRALQFGGNEVINTNADTLIHGLTEMTWCAWYNLNDTDEDHILIGDGTNGINSVLLFMNREGLDSDGNPAENVLEFYVWGAPRTNGANMIFNEWGHVCGVFSGSEFLRLYVNGELADENTSGIPSDIPSINRPLCIGARDNCNLSYANGLIDDVRIYNRALSAAEVAKLYATTGGGAAPQDCTGLGDAHWNDAASGHCYFRVNPPPGGISRPDAQAACAAEDAYLAIPGSAEEQAAYVSGLGVSNRYSWIGGSDAAVEGEWRFDGGELDGQLFWQGNASGSAQNGMYSNWDEIEPQGLTADEDCILYLSNSSEWVDSECSMTSFSGFDFGYICEKSADPVGGTCSNPRGVAGEMVYNEDFNVMQWCNGSEWVRAQ